MKIFRVAGPCITGQCDCNLHDGKEIKNDKDMPPLHEGCMCYAEEVDERIEKLNSQISRLKYEYGNLNDTAKSLDYRIHIANSLLAGPFKKENDTCEDDREIEKEVIKAYNKKPFCPHCGQLITKKSVDNYEKILYNIIIEYRAKGRMILDKISAKTDKKLRLIEKNKKKKGNKSWRKNRML